MLRKKILPGGGDGKKIKKNSAGLRPAAGRPEAGSEIHIVLALGPAGKIFGSEIHNVRSNLDPLFDQNLHFRKVL